MVERGISRLTEESYRAALREFCSFLGCDREPIQAGEADIKKYVSFCYARELTPRTVLHRISVLREFFKFGQIDGLIQRNPTDRIESPKQWKTVPRFLSENEARDLIETGPTRNDGPLWRALELRDRAICEVFYAGGLRVSELTSARLVDLNLERGVLTVFGKGSKERITPIGRHAVDSLRRYLETARPLLQEKRKASRYLFLGRWNARPLTRQAICNLLRRRARRAELTHVHPHMLRHSAATHMMNHGADLRVIQEVLGHADIGTTELYTHSSQERVRSVLLRCHPRNDPRRKQIKLFADPAIVTPQAEPCIECSHPAMLGKTRCERHVRLASAASKRLYEARIARGQCAHCSEPLAAGNKSCCAFHVIYQREQNRRAHLLSSAG